MALTDASFTLLTSKFFLSVNHQGTGELVHDRQFSSIACLYANFKVRTILYSIVRGIRAKDTAY